MSDAQPSKPRAAGPPKPYAVGPLQRFVKVKASGSVYTEGHAVIRRETPENVRQTVAKYKSLESACRLRDLLNELHDDQV